ncbi:MAG TPA: hypothetical protein VM783_04025, partial [Candidatus Acidoferrum sp.]|nr:hypothetical protein [Candidatus Acidoferrum sp.]
LLAERYQPVAHTAEGVIYRMRDGESPESPKKSAKKKNVAQVKPWRVGPIKTSMSRGRNSYSDDSRWVVSEKAGRRTARLMFSSSLNMG